jgi:phage terminase large subunit
MVYDITDDHRPVHDGTYKVCMVDDITADNASEKREAQGYFGIDSSFSSSSHYSSSV